MKFRIWIVLAALLLLTGCRSSASGNGSASQNNAGAAGNGSASPAMSQGLSQAAITKEEAESIALEQAGLTADQVTGLRTEYEIDDGVPRYEVQFRQGRWEYDYEINADTGEILSYDRDD